MIETLRISEIKIVEKAELEFDPGLNVLTGETGAGKSIILGALEMLAGARGSADIPRKGSDLGVVEAVFRTEGLPDSENELSERGFVDAFRGVNQSPEQYTWWSNRGRSWEKNVGWRIDYHVVSPSLKAGIKKASIYKRKRFSDHAPLIIDYDIR